MTKRTGFSLGLALQILACVLFFLGGIGGGWSLTNPPVWPWNGRLVSWGLFCWCLSEFFN